MNYMEFASDLPLDCTIVFNSAEENEEVMQRCGVNQVVRQMGAGKFRADLAVRSTEQADLFADRFNKAISIYLEPPTGTVGILFPRSASGQFLASGHNVGNDKLVVLPDGTGTDIVIPDLAGSEAIAIPVKQFNAMAEVLSPMFVRPEGLTVLEGNMTQLNHLRQAIIKLVAHPELELNDEQLSNLLAAMIVWLADSSQSQQAEDINVHRAQIRIVKLAQSYIEAHYCNTVCLEDLCRVTAVGARTLQRYFREYFDMTITEYLKTVRFNAAHRELTTSYPAEHSVTDIAMQHGFTHLGRFSTEFRERFGQSPRDTLTRLAGQKS
jgi:AraC-like DNA-binding protein